MLGEVFPGVQPCRFVYSPAVSPLKTELFGLRRNYARDQVKLNDLYTDWYAAGGYYFGPVGLAIRFPREIERLEDLQDLRQARIAQIVAKLEA